MRIVDLTKPETNRWSYPKYDKIVFTGSDGSEEEDVVCTIRLNEKSATLETGHVGEVYAFLTRPSEGVKLMEGEYAVLMCGDCFGLKKTDKIVWFLVFSEPRLLKKMTKKREGLVNSKNTFCLSSPASSSNV